MYRTLFFLSGFWLLGWVPMLMAQDETPSVSRPPTAKEESPTNAETALKLAGILAPMEEEAIRLRPTNGPRSKSRVPFPTGAWSEPAMC